MHFIFEGNSIKIFFCLSLSFFPIQSSIAYLCFFFFIQLDFVQIFFVVYVILFVHLFQHLKNNL